MNYYGQELHTNDAFNGAFKARPHNSYMGHSIFKKGKGLCAAFRAYKLILFTSRQARERKNLFSSVVNLVAIFA
jgi:hypothetical protein